MCSKCFEIIVHFRDKRPEHHLAVTDLKDSKLVPYAFRVVRETLIRLDKVLAIDGSTGVEGSDVILGHIRSIGLVLTNYAVKPNPEAEGERLLPCIESLMLIIQLVSSHFGQQKEEFFKNLDMESNDTGDEVLLSLAMHAKTRLTGVQDNIKDDDDDDEGFDACKAIGGYFR